MIASIPHFHKNPLALIIELILCEIWDFHRCEDSSRRLSGYDAL